MFENILLIVIWLIIYFACDILSWLMADKWNEPWGYFDRYPFKCRKCSAIWTKAFAYTVFCYLHFNWFIFVISILAVIADICFYLYTERERRDDGDNKRRIGFY